MPTGLGFSVETQVTGREAKGGIQIEITPEREDPTRVVLVRTLTGKTLGVPIRSDGTVGQLKELIEDQEGIPEDQQRLIYGGRQLEDHRTLNECDIHSSSAVLLGLRLRGGGYIHDTPPPPPPPPPPRRLRRRAAGSVTAEEPLIRKPSTMVIAAGGKIKQVIHADRMSNHRWEPSRTTVFNVNIVKSAAFAQITGKQLLETPINAALYAKYGYPFFELLEANSGIHGEFTAVKSVAQIDNVKEEQVVPREVTLRAKRGPDGKWRRRDVPVPGPPGITNPEGPLREFRTVHEMEEEIRALKMEDMMDTKWT